MAEELHNLNLSSSATLVENLFRSKRPRLLEKTQEGTRPHLELFRPYWWKSKLLFSYPCLIYAIVCLSHHNVQNDEIDDPTCGKTGDIERRVKIQALLFHSLWSRWKNTSLNFIMQLAPKHHRE